MKNNTLFDNISKVQSMIEAEHGNFELFCIVELEGLEGEWDVIVSAKWLPTSEMQALSFLIDYLHKYLSDDDLLCISRIVTLSNDEPFVREALKLSQDNMQNLIIEGLSIKTIRILSRKNNIAQAKLESVAQKLGIFLWMICICYWKCYLMSNPLIKI